MTPSLKVNSDLELKPNCIPSENHNEKRRKDNQKQAFAQKGKNQT